MNPVRWPSKKGNYKFVQLYVKDEPYMFFRLAGENTHAEILEMALGSLRIGFEYRPGFLEGKVPNEKGNNYRASGMGQARILPEEKSALFGGSSFDYDIATDPEHLEKIKALFPDWDIELLK